MWWINERVTSAYDPREHWTFFLALGMLDGRSLRREAGPPADADFKTAAVDHSATTPGAPSPCPLDAEGSGW
jgi:hypothetical protein